MPPFEQALQLRSRGAPCGQCKQSGQQPWIYTDGVFPGGVRMRCQTCGDLWLEAEG